MKQHSLLSNISDVLLLTLCYRIIGFIREMLIASFLGASAEADAYAIAYSAPAVVIEILALGAVGSASIAVFQEIMKKDGQKRLTQLYSRLMTAILCTLLVLLALSELFSLYLTRLMAPSFSTVKLSLTHSMIKKMLPAILFMGILGIQKAALNFLDDFKSEGFSNIIFNCSMVVGVFLAQRLNVIDILVYSFVCAACLQSLFQYYRLRRLGIKPALDFYFIDDDLKKIFVLLLPIMFSSLVSQLTPVAARAIASTCKEGAVAMLTYAYKATMLPIGVITGAISTASFPRISFYAVEKSPKLQSFSSGTLKLSLAVFVPITALIAAGSVPIINIIFERGSFNTANTYNTAKMLAAYAPTVLLTSIICVLSNNFYAFKQTKKPIIINCICTLIGIILAIGMSKTCSAAGIPLGLSFGMLLNAAILSKAANKLHPNLVSISLKEILFCALSFIIIGTVTLKFSSFYCENLYQKNILLRALHFGVYCCFTLTVYALSVYRFNFLNIKDTLKLFRKKE